jgi:hypothetical protein
MTASLPVESDYGQILIDNHRDYTAWTKARHNNN